MQTKNHAREQQKKNSLSLAWITRITGIACMMITTPSFSAPIITTNSHPPQANLLQQDTDSIKSEGGLMATSPDDKNQWFSTSGLLRLDGALFMGSANTLQNHYPNGANISSAEWSIKGGVGNGWTYLMRLKLSDGKARMTDAALDYNGFAPNAVFSVGQLNPTFSLDNENSTSWQPFIDSASTSVFYPGNGLGFRYSMWWNQYAFKLAALQPAQTTNFNSRWQLSGRAFYTPINRLGDVFHLGIGGVFKEIEHKNLNGGDIKRLNLNVSPGAKARTTATLAQLVEPGVTASGNASDLGMRAKATRQFNLEIARQAGPFLFFGEYFHMYVKRPSSTINNVSFSPKNVRFRGWFLQGSWLLTGESREYAMADGTFNTIKPLQRSGAWELATRYAYTNLTDRDIQGGSQHDVSLGLNWFYNENLRISATYIRSHVHPAVIYSDATRKLNIVSGRIQVRW